MFFGDILVNNFHILSLRARKNDFFPKNNVRNVFSNIELPLGYNIMNLEYVLERIWKEIAKNMWKKSKIRHIRHFLGGTRPWGDFGVFPASGQADFEHQRHLRRGAENFQKVWYEKIFEMF